MFGYFLLHNLQKIKKIDLYLKQETHLYQMDFVFQNHLKMNSIYVKLQLPLKLHLLESLM